jgi:NAD(P)-dependent dehydrogenase (short-subunit alcohol dehydrogenase family)
VGGSAVNATAVFAACREAFPHLAKAGGGIIVNIGSFFDKLGVKRNLAYCASKAAVGAMTRCLAVEWAAKGIRVVDIAPGYIETDLNRDALTKGPLRDFLARRIPGGLCQRMALLNMSASEARRV